MKGKDRFLRKLRFYSSREFNDLAGAVIHEAADAVRAEAHSSISRGSVSGAGHKPSAPNEPPNRNLGDLPAGIVVARTGILSAEVQANAAHSAPLEFGSSKRNLIQRPFIRPARDKAAAGAIDKAVRKMRAEVRRKTRG